MSLMIKGMEMPKDYQQHNINLFNTADGFWANEYRFKNSESKYKTRLLYSVVEIPAPHGRLIDADVLMDLLEKSVPEKNRGHQFYVFRHMLRNAPTILEAEEK